MKVIDLLNKIANGEIEEDVMFEYSHGNGYKEYANINTLFDRFTINEENLNTEIEITEEDKKIEKIPYMFNLKYVDTNDKEVVINGINDAINGIYDKINEIIDYLEENNNE